MENKRHNRFSSFYAEPSGGEGERCLYPTRLDTYGCGCQHDCKYCYAKSLLSFRGLWKPDNPSVAEVDYILRKLKKVRPGTVLRLGGMTDCFQPMEKKYRATYQLIKMLNARKIEYLIVTKSDMVAEPMYRAVLDPGLAHIQITVTSTSDKPNILGERATPISKRVEAIESLSKAGFDVCLRVSPYMPELFDMKALNRVKADKCLVEFLRVNHWIEKWLGGGKFATWTEKSGGYKHLPLSVKKACLEDFQFKEMSVCEDVPEHYEYFRNNFNANPNDRCNLRRNK